MLHFFTKVILALSVLTLFAGCTKGEDDPTAKEEGGTTDVKSALTITPQADASQSPFVGKWKGRGPGYTTTGTWQFFEDGTYKWDVYNIYNYHKGQTGNWKYNAEAKILYTDGETPWNWEVIDVAENTWVARRLDGEQAVYTYSREETLLDPQQPEPIDFKTGSIRFNAVIQNKEFCTKNFKAGICYSVNGGQISEFDSPDIKKIYTQKISKPRHKNFPSNISISEYSQEFTDDTNSFANIIDVTVSGLEVDRKYLMYSFVEDEDGNITMSSTGYKAICIEVPENFICMEVQPEDGFAYFWQDPSTAIDYDQSAEYTFIPSSEELKRLVEINALSCQYISNQGYKTTLMNMNGNKLEFPCVDSNNWVDGIMERMREITPLYMCSVISSGRPYIKPWALVSPSTPGYGIFERPESYVYMTGYVGRESELKFIKCMDYIISY